MYKLPVNDSGTYLGPLDALTIFLLSAVGLP
jgi:hypothetical protein